MEAQARGGEPELTTEEAVTRLGVKPATLYAYVSRGLLRRRRGADGRSRFSLADVERLRQRGRSATGPAGMAVESGLTSVERDTIFFRGQNALDIAGRQGFEETALWLWTGAERSGERPWSTDAAALATGQAVQQALAVGTLPLDRLRVTVAAIAPTDPLRYDTSEQAVRITGRRLISALVDSLPLAGAPPPDDARVARRFWSRLTAEPPNQPLLDLLEAALVLLVDHELSLSTLSARLAASILADPYSVVAVGLSALGGPFHAVASLAAEDLLSEVSLPQRAAWTIGERLRRGDRLPGFGHRVHTGGDPRASFLLDQLQQACAGSPQLAVVEAILDATRERGLPAPNVDFALASLAHVTQMTRGASEAIFGLARVAGWIAHALEVYAGGFEVRPQVLYVGTAAGPER
ncbi:MAG TPA: citrate/2-methylcitrate synthase [Candidatus Binatia bacterium]|nr:citrate/2-methylcitrate synthase [Candidatus Binatia bacterium]